MLTANATTITLARKAESAPVTSICHDKLPCEVKLADGTIRPMTRYERFCHERADKFGKCAFVVIL
jgi:hypothetical protein